LISTFLSDRIPSYNKFVMPYALPLGENSRGTVDPFKMNGLITLPEVFVWEDFQEKLIEQGKSIFNTQYNLKTLEDADVICKQEDLRYFVTPPVNYVRHMVVDPAVSESGVNNATGITIVDWDELGTMYVLYAEEFWISPVELIKKIEELRKLYDPDEIFIEKDKAAITIADTLEYLAPKLNLSFVEPKNIPKDRRINRLTQWFDSKRVLLKQGMKDFENQLIEYPDVDNKDMLDSLAYQLIKMELPNKKGIRELEVNVEPTFEDEMNKATEFYESRKENFDAIF